MTSTDGINIDLTETSSEALTALHEAFLAESREAMNPAPALTRAGIIAGEMVNRFLAGLVPADNSVIVSTVSALRAAGMMDEGDTLADVMGGD